MTSKENESYCVPANNSSVRIKLIDGVVIDNATYCSDSDTYKWVDFLNGESVNCVCTGYVVRDRWEYNQ